MVRILSPSISSKSSLSSSRKMYLRDSVSEVNSGVQNLKSMNRY